MPPSKPTPRSASAPNKKPTTTKSGAPSVRKPTNEGSRGGAAGTAAKASNPGTAAKAGNSKSPPKKVSTNRAKPPTKRDVTGTKGADQAAPPATAPSTAPATGAGVSFAPEPERSERTPPEEGSPENFVRSKRMSMKAKEDWAEKVSDVVGGTDATMRPLLRHNTEKRINLSVSFFAFVSLPTTP